MKLSSVTAALKAYETKKTKWFGFVLSKLFGNPIEIEELKKRVQYGKSVPDYELSPTEFLAIIKLILDICAKASLSDVNGDLYRFFDCETLLITEFGPEQFKQLKRWAADKSLREDAFQLANKLNESLPQASHYKNRISGFSLTPA